MAAQRRRLDFERSQNIALLSLLTKNPTSLQINECASSVPRGGKGRVLSLERESHLAEALAFISGVSDNSDHVVAICIEELSGSGGLRVLIAVNRSTHANPPDRLILDRIKSGLEALFRVLARADTESAALEEQTLDAIIDLCRNRILSRIRSQRDDFPSSGRPFSGSKLGNILSAVSRHLFRDSRLRSDAKLFIHQTERLQEAVKEVESSEAGRVNVALKKLVVTAYSLHRGGGAVNIEEILKDLPNRELDPSNTGWLKGFIKKLARYRECSAYLLRVSERNALLRNMTVLPVSLGQECFQRQGESPGEQCLANCVSRCLNGTGAPENSPRAKALRNLGTSRFLPVLRKIIKDSRIHAEVQIVAYYELHPPPIQPRIIKSSKNACYLCNLFIKEHGKFYTPRTHGKLYTGWRLPNLEKLNHAQTKLNEALEARIRHGSLEYVQTRRTQALISVNESDLGSLSSMSSLGSFGLLSGNVDVVDKAGTGVKVKVTNFIPSPKGNSVPSTQGQPSGKAEAEASPGGNGGSSKPPQSTRGDSQPTMVQSTLEVSVQKNTETSQPLETIREAEYEPPEVKVEEPDQVVEEAVSALETTVDEREAQQDITQHSSSEVSLETQKIAGGGDIKVEPTIQHPPEPGPVIEQTDTSPEEPPHDGDPSAPNPDLTSKSDYSISRTSPPPHPEPTPRSEQDSDQDQISLTQGRVYTFRLDRDRKIPSYRTENLIIYPEYIISTSSSTGEDSISPASTSPSSPSTSKREGMTEMRITWLLPSQPDQPSSQSRSQEGRHNRESNIGTKPATFLHPDLPKPVPEYLVESLSTSRDTNTGSRESVRLVNGGGDTVLIEVVRS